MPCSSVYKARSSASAPYHCLASNAEDPKTFRDCTSLPTCSFSSCSFLSCMHNLTVTCQTTKVACWPAAAGGRDSEEREGSQERLQGDGDADGNGASGAEDGAPGGEGGAEDKDTKPQGGGLRMWRAARDRAAWKADVLHVRSHHPASCLRPAASSCRALLYTCLSQHAMVV